MSRRFNINTLFCLSVSAFIIVIGLQYTLKTPSIISTDVASKTYDYSINTDRIIENTREKIKFELKSYNLTNSDIRVLEDLLVESGGQPIKTLILSSWRSGSTFFGDLLQSIPGTFYHYEPLLNYGIVQIRAPPNSNRAISNIRNLFKCNFDRVEDYFEFGKTDQIQFRQNKWLWNICKDKNQLCFDAKFTSRFCRLFPFQLMKLCRLRLRLVQDILDDKELNVKVILLIRDPRGVMNSRRHRYFCQTGLDCWQPELLCADMIRDYMAASTLLPKYPDRVMVIRFEDLALNPKQSTKKILKFLKLSYSPSIEEFLKTHTNEEVVGFDSTFRISRNVPFKWQKGMGFQDVTEIQMMCKEAMKLWGYRLAHNETHMASKEFKALGNYIIKPIVNFND